ncbi:MAG: ATP-binding protein [Paludibacteraceae bacterium]
MSLSDRKKDDIAKFMKLKVAGGYFLILFLAVVTMFFILNNIRDFTFLNAKDTITKEKMNCLNETFFHLYEAECIIGETLVDPVRFKDYSQKSNLIKIKIDTLKCLFDDEVQLSQLDSLKILLDIKESNVRSLAFLAARTSIDDIYKNNLYKTIADNDSLLRSKVVEQTTTVKNDTVTYKRPNKKKPSFFKRLSRIFSSEEPVDTTIQVRKSEFVVTDTLVTSYNPADTINQLLENLKGQVHKEKAHIDRGITKKLIELQLNNRAINVQVNSILHNLQDEDLKNLLDTMDERDASMARVSFYLRYIAMAAVLLVFVFIFMVCRDISRSRRYRRGLEEANRTTLKMMESREKLMLGITHDIKAPLGSIIGYIELLNDNKLNSKQCYYLDNMKTSSEHILHLVTDILDFNRLDAGRVELNLLPFNSRNLFTEVADSFRPQAEKKKLTLDFVYESNHATDILVGDPLRIRQIVNNLMSNALKFTVTGFIKLTVKLSCVEANGCCLEIEVSDSGIGISEEDQKIIFQEYTRIGKKNMANTEGFGLGLSIVYKLVDMHHGHLSLKSKLGEGSVFFVSLPLSPASEEKTQMAMTPQNGKVPNVLVIDDDQSQLTMVSEQMKRLGLLFTTCDNPYSALEIIEKNTFDIIFSDIQMPGFNGFEIVKRIRNAHFRNARTIPVIALSARADISVSQFRKHGFTSFLNKPFTSDQLFELISKYVNTNQCVPLSPKNQKAGTDDGENDRFKKVLSFAGGDRNSELEILSSFVKETEKNVRELTFLLEKKDVNGINRLSHKMLAIFKMLGEKALVDWLTKLERIESLDLVDRAVFDENIRLIERITEEGKMEIERLRT